MPTITKPNLYFDVVTYTGTGATQTISGLNFQPDFVWIKNRTNGANWHVLTDAVRGVQKEIYTNSTAAEATLTTTGVNQFNSNGFQILGNSGDYNRSGDNYVAWCWKANGTGVTNNAGSITSTVSANTTSGFSVVTYTGTGANATIGHGLGVAPSMVFVKSRSNALHWVIYATAMGSPINYLLFNTDPKGSAATVWNNTAPTSTVFSIGTDSTPNTNGGTYVAYCFAEVAGYSKIGSYIGNGVADGPFIYCGFKPAFVMFKNASSTGAWGMYDRLRAVTYNPQNAVLYPNYSNAENIDPSYTYIDFVSNGIKIRSTGADFNYISGNTYIFMAFAENPFKYALAR